MHNIHNSGNSCEDVHSIRNGRIRGEDQFLLAHPISLEIEETLCCISSKGNSIPASLKQKKKKTLRSLKQIKKQTSAILPKSISTPASVKYDYTETSVISPKSIATPVPVEYDYKEMLCLCSKEDCSYCSCIPLKQKYDYDFQEEDEFKSSAVENHKYRLQSLKIKKEHDLQKGGCKCCGTEGEKYHLDLKVKKEFEENITPEEKHFQEFSQLLNHLTGGRECEDVKRQSSNKVFHCDLCAKVYSREGLLKNHVKKHSKIKKKTRTREGNRSDTQRFLRKRKKRKKGS